MPDNWGYVFAAYGLAVIALGAYWRRLARRAKSLAGDADSKLGGAILLIDPTSTALPSSTSSFVTGDRDSSVRGYVYGGTSAVSASLYQAAVTALN